MKTIRIAVVGTGWIGHIRAMTCASHALVGELHIADIDSEVAARSAQATSAASWTTDYYELLDSVDAAIISTTPETTHYPIARDFLQAGKHVLLEKPIGLTLEEADDLIELAERSNLKLSIGYTQRFNPRYAYIKKCIDEGLVGAPVTALISRHITRAIGAKIAGRGELGPAQMEATHDIDLVLWWLGNGVRAKTVYARSVFGMMKEKHGLPDCTWIMVSNDDGTTFTIGANWNLPVEYPGMNSVIVEFIGRDGALFVDETHRDVLLTTVKNGLQRPLSTMPGEQAGHVFQGPMEAETRHFIESVALDRPVLVTARQARAVMEITLAAEMSAESLQPIALPLK
ncbi:MAG: Gfo/Idh/MocA family protein [Candidatus Dormibacteraceae bacterium]